MNKTPREDALERALTAEQERHDRTKTALTVAMVYVVVMSVIAVWGWV